MISTRLSRCIVPFTNLGLGDIVPSRRDSGTHASDMEFGAGKAHVPDTHFDFFGERMFEQVCYRASAERRFKGEVQSLGNSAFQQPLSLEPGSAVRFPLGHFGICGSELQGCFIRIKVFGPAFAEHRAAHAALSCAVGPRQNVDARNVVAVSHVCARRPRRPCRVALARRQTRPSFRRALWGSASPPATHQIHRSAFPAWFAPLARASSYSSIESRTALGVSCLVMSTMPLRRTVSRTSPSLFLAWVALIFAGVSPRRLRIAESGLCLKRLR